MPGTAVFDLDRTITIRPTWTRFCFYANRTRPGFWLRLPLWMARGIALKLGLADRQSYKRYSLLLLSALSRDEIDARAREFAARDIASGLRPGALRAIEQHKTNKDYLIMATACCRLLARHYGELLGFDDVIATDVCWEENRVPPPRMEKTNCYGEEKLARVMALKDAGTLKSPVFAYSDHISDLPLLLSADHGVAVNPDRKMRRAAQQTTISVVDFNT